MSGFTRDTKHYGDRLVYEALESKWGRYHATHCGCDRDWVTVHAEPAGFTVVRERPGFVALVGPGLTEGVDEERLTANALWEAVTGKPGTQDWYEPVRVTCRCDHCEAKERAHWDALRAERKARAEDAKTSPLTDKQFAYLEKLADQLGRARVDRAFADAIKGTAIHPRRPREHTRTMLRRLTRASARKMIGTLRDDATALRYGLPLKS